VAVRPHEGVGEEPLFAVTLAGVDDLSEVFEIHLVNDTRSRRDDTEIVERLLSPFERTVSLAVALVLQFDVLLVGVRGAEVVDLHAVVDHEVTRYIWFDDGGILAFSVGRRPERCEVDDRGDTGEIRERPATV